MVYPVILREGEDGQFVAECPSIDGCFSQGASVQDALANIREAIALCLEVIQARGEPLPSPGTTLLSEVSIRR